MRARIELLITAILDVRMSSSAGELVMVTDADVVSVDADSDALLAAVGSPINFLLHTLILHSRSVVTMDATDTSQSVVFSRNGRDGYGTAVVGRVALLR